MADKLPQAPRVRNIEDFSESPGLIHLALRPQVISSANLPALVMIISVPASWNFFQSSFSCSPTLMFSMVWGQEGGRGARG